jgi:drug/metabolite transporter (DMT)-like permease
LLAILGAALLMGESYEASHENLIGDLFCLLAGIFYAGYVLLMQRARGSAGSWEVLATATLAGTLPLLLTALWMDERILPTNWTPLLMLAFSSQVLGQGLLIYALPYFSGLVIGLALLIQPAIAALLGWANYGEQLTVPELIGGVAVGAALVLARLPTSPAARKIGE